MGRPTYKPGSNMAGILAWVAAHGDVRGATWRNSRPETQRMLKRLVTDGWIIETYRGEYGPKYEIVPEADKNGISVCTLCTLIDYKPTNARKWRDVEERDINGSAWQNGVDTAIEIGHPDNDELIEHYAFSTFEMLVDQGELS